MGHGRSRLRMPPLPRMRRYPPWVPAGPGAINLLLGTADATTNSTPVVAFSAQVGLSRIHKESHQSVDLVAMFSPGDQVGGPGS